MGAFNVFQIYYDEASRAKLDPGFRPLDNTQNLRPDWFEFWVIRSFLHNNRLEEDSWYGFLSPNFQHKTGLTSEHIRRFTDFMGDRGEVALILTGWDQVAYFLNPFEQGEIWHPGITALSQLAVDAIGYKSALTNLVSHSGNFTFSNYIIAKAAYWRDWLAMADRFFALVEDQASALAARLRQTTDYGSSANQTPVKTFIQERLPALILSQRRFRAATFNTSDTFPIFDQLFEIDLTTRGALQTCDRLKKRYTETGDPKFIEIFKEVRRLVTTKFTAPAEGATSFQAAGMAPSTPLQSV
jgi:hypothetical protein